MKKILSVILALVTVLSAFSVLASADDESTEEKNIDGNLLSYFYCCNGPFYRIAFDEKYKSFGENVCVETADEFLSEESLKTYSGESLKCLTEQTRKDNVMYESLVIYAVVPVHECRYIIIPENTVFDAEGNGNEEIIVSSGWRNLYLTTSVNSITVNMNFPVDCYVNGERVAENTFDYTVKCSKPQDYTLTVKKFGYEIYKGTKNPLDAISIGDMTGSKMADSIKVFFGVLLYPLGEIGSLLSFSSFLAILLGVSPVIMIPYSIIKQIQYRIEG